MIEQFQNILRTPKNLPQNYLKKAQDLILNTLQAIFPPDYDFRQLGHIYDNPQISSDTTKLTYYLVEYFSQMVSNNFISIHSYSCLEEQTQKSQSTIRSHIKLEQEMKMYLEHLEGKILKYENYINYYIRKLSNGRGASLGLDQMPNNKDTLLMKERLSLLRKNDFLQRKLVQKENQLRRVRSIVGSDKLDLVKSIEEKDKIVLSKINHSRAESSIVYQPYSSQNIVEKKESTMPFPATLAESVIEHHPISAHPPPPPRPSDPKSLLININGNNNQFTYYVRSHQKD